MMKREEVEELDPLDTGCFVVVGFGVDRKGGIDWAWSFARGVGPPGGESYLGVVVLGRGTETFKHQTREEGASARPAKAGKRYGCIFPFQVDDLV